MIKVLASIYSQTITFISKKDNRAKGEDMSKLLLVAVIVVVVGIGSVSGAYWYIEENEDDEKIENNPPVAVITSPTNGQQYNIENKITFDGEQSSDLDGDDLTFEWESNLDYYLGTDEYFEMTLETTGTHIITLTVKDNEDENSVSVNIEVVGEEEQNHAPVAVIDSPNDGDIFYTTNSIEFDGSSSSDEDNDVLTYKWTSSISGIIEENDESFSTVLDKGEHEIILEVTDGLGEKSEDSIDIEVKEAGTNNAPELTDGKVDPESGTLDDTFVFSVIYKDEDNDQPNKIKVKIDDTEFNMESEGGSNYENGVTYNYEISGEDLGEDEHEFQFLANDGLVDATGDIDIHQGPEVNSQSDFVADISVNTTKARVGDNISFNGINSTGNIVNWTWDFGDGNISYDENNTNHSYDMSDNYTATLTIEDSEGNTDEESIDITIKNRDFYSNDNDWSGDILFGGNTDRNFEVLDGVENPIIYAYWEITNQNGNPLDETANITINLYDANDAIIYTRTYEIQNQGDTWNNNTTVEKIDVENYGNYTIETISNEGDTTDIEYLMRVSVIY